MHFLAELTFDFSFSSRETTENGENFIEVPLIFESVEEVDFYTDFKCLAQNRYGSQVLPTRVKQEGNELNCLSGGQTFYNCYNYSKTELSPKSFTLSKLVLRWIITWEKLIASFNCRSNMHSVLE